MPEENEPNIAPARSVFRRAAATRSPWVWLFCAAAAVVVVILLLASLPYPPWEPRSSANRRATAPTVEPSTAPAAPAAPAAGGAYTIFAWRDGEGVLRRAGIATTRYDEFVAAARRQIDEDKRALAVAQGNRLRTGLAPLFEQIDERVSGYADWVFDWWTSWILLTRTFGWTWDELTAGPLLTLPDRVQTKLVASVREQFIGRVLEPRLLEPQIDETALRAEFPVLLELKAGDSPINDVILRLARPFATKLISFVVLPVIIAAILGGIVLPLFRRLPSVLANIVTGILTGALGALVIGLAASASVDWVLNRTDATLNRAGFEATVRKAIIATERDFEARVLAAQERAIDRQMQAVATAMAGKIAAP